MDAYADRYGGTNYVRLFLLFCCFLAALFYYDTTYSEYESQKLSQVHAQVYAEHGIASDSK